MASQLAALHKRVFVENRPSYTDFSVGTPFERRMSRVQKCRVYTRHLPSARPTSSKQLHCLESVVERFQSSMPDAEHLFDCVIGGIRQAGGETDDAVATLLGVDIPRS